MVVHLEQVHRLMALSAGKELQRSLSSTLIQCLEDFQTCSTHPHGLCPKPNKEKQFCNL